MNQILNMIFRIFMRKMISRGIDAGIKQATGGGKGKRPAPAPEPETPAEGGMTRDQVRAKRRARRAARAEKNNGSS